MTMQPRKSITCCITSTPRRRTRPAMMPEMTRLRATAIAVVLTSVLVACGGGGGGNGLPQETQRSSTPGDASVSGTVTITSGGSIPAGSQLAVRVFDATVKDTTSAAIVGQAEIVTAGEQPPLEFEVGY